MRGLSGTADNRRLVAPRIGGCVKYGFRTPSLRKSIAARTSIRRIVRNATGLKAPRGYGWLTNPKRAAYNRVYNRTSVSVGGLGVKIIAALLRGLFRR